MRLQLRSSLVKPAKKVIGKQRLTVLVNVSFPAPNIDLQGSLEVCKSLKKDASASVFVSVRSIRIHGHSGLSRLCTKSQITQSPPRTLKLCRIPRHRRKGIL